MYGPLLRFVYSPSLGLFLFLSCTYGQEQTLDTLIDATRQSIKDTMEMYQIPGVAVAICDRRETMWLECFGHRDGSRRLPVTPKTAFSIQSTSKAVTATAVMLAVQDGRLDLDTEVTKYLPNYVANSVFENSPEKKISLRRLLNHTAGLTGEASGANNSIAGILPFSEYAKTIQKTWLVSPVGSRHYYSNISIDLAGNVLQAASRRPFAQVIKEDLFEPLGMSRSFVDTPETNGSSKNVAKGHGPDFLQLPEYLPISASGGIRMSIEDAVRFVQFHLNHGKVNGKELLKPHLLDQMYARSVRVFKGGESVWYGLGINSWSEANTYALAHHGAGFGFRCVMKWYPEYGIGVVMMANGFDVDFDQWEATRYVLRDMVQGGITKRIKDNATVSAERFFSNTPAPFISDKSSVPPLEPTPFRTDFKQYLGRYRMVFGGGFRLTPTAEAEQPKIRLVEKGGYMVFRRNGVEERLFEHEPGLFFMENFGEALDLRGIPPRLANLALEKIE